MSTMLEECYTEERRSVVRYVWAKGFNEMFPVYGGKCLSGSQLGPEILARTFESREVVKWLRQQPQDFCAAGFDALLKRRTSVSMLVEDKTKLNSVVLVRKRTIPTERPPLSAK
jgi:hypothetical protein